MTSEYVKSGDLYINTTTGERISEAEYNEIKSKANKTTRKNSRKSK